MMSVAAFSQLSRGSAPSQRAIPLESPLEWKQALSSIPHSFFHTWEHSYAMYLTHKLPAYLYCFEHAGVRIICPFIERPFQGYIDIATPYGFSGFAGNADYPDLPLYWNEFVRSRGYVSAFLTLHPLFCRSGYTRMEETHELKSLYILDTMLESHMLLSKCTKSRRQDIQKWQTGVLSLVNDKALIARFVLDNYRDFFRRKKASFSYDFSPATIQFILDLDSVFAVGAACKGEIKAVHITVFTSYAAEYLFYFCVPGAERNSSGLIWEAASFLRIHGIKAFNLGGGLVNGDALDDFKRRFGGKRHSLRVLKQAVRPDIYDELCWDSELDPRVDRDYFPAYRS